MYKHNSMQLIYLDFNSFIRGNIDLLLLVFNQHIFVMIGSPAPSSSSTPSASLAAVVNYPMTGSPMAPMPPPGPQAQQSSQESPAPPTSASPAPFQPSQTDPPPVIPPQAQSVPLPATPGSADLPPEGLFI